MFAYTVKGYGLASSGHPQNHSSLLTDDQMRDLSARLGTDLDDPWRKFAEGSDASVWCDAISQLLRRHEPEFEPVPAIPTDMGRTPSGNATTQAALAECSST